MEQPITEVTNRENTEQQRTDLKNPSTQKSATKSAEKPTETITENRPAGSENTEQTEQRAEGEKSLPEGERKEGERKEGERIEEEKPNLEGKQSEKKDELLGKRSADQEANEKDNKEEPSEPQVEKRLKPESVQKGVKEGEQPPTTTAAEGQ